MNPAVFPTAMPDPAGLFVDEVVVHRAATGAGQPGYGEDGVWADGAGGGSAGACDRCVYTCDTATSGATYTTTIGDEVVDVVATGADTPASIAAKIAAAIALALPDTVSVSAAGNEVAVERVEGEDRPVVSLSANLRFVAIELHIRASVQPVRAGLREAMLLAQGNRLRGEIVVITNDELRTINDATGAPPDVVEWHGARYEVQVDESYAVGALNHHEYIAQRENVE